MPVGCEECFDVVVSSAFDLPIVAVLVVVVVVVAVVAESYGRVVEPIVVVGVVVTDVGAGGKRSAVVDAERLGATNTSTANNGRLRGGAVSDVGFEVAVFGGKVEPLQNRVA